MGRAGRAAGIAEPVFDCAGIGKRARQLIEEANSLSKDVGTKPLSEAIQEIYDGRVKIIGDSEEDIEEDKVQEEQKEEEGQ